MILGIDLGSSYFKAALLSRSMKLLGLGSAPLHHRFGTGGHVELPVDHAEEAFRQAIAAALRSGQTRASRLQAVAIASQAQTFTISRRPNRPLLPFISWQDNRATAACQQLKKSPALREFGRHCSFGQLLPALQICQLKHLRTDQPTLFSRSTHLLPLPTFFLERLTGRAAIDPNLAAMSGLYSLAGRTWWPAALRAVGLAPHHLPELAPLGSIAAHTTAGAAAFGLPARLPIVLAGNDQTAGAYAARLEEHQGVLITLGTAQVAYRYSRAQPRQHPDLIRGPFPLGGHYRMAADAVGGNLINWAETVLSGCGTDDAFFKQAGLAPVGCDGLRLELGNSFQQGTWRNMGAQHSPAHFARSVLESLALRMRRLLRQLGVTPARTRVLAAGGGSASPLWIRILEEMLGTSITVIQAPPFLGAARLAVHALDQTQSTT